MVYLHGYLPPTETVSGWQTVAALFYEQLDATVFIGITVNRDKSCPLKESTLNSHGLALVPTPACPTGQEQLLWCI